MARTSAVPLSRRIVEAAVELSGNNPNRMVAIEAIVEHLGLARNEKTVAALAQAIKDGYLKPNAGKHLHTVAVTHKWRYEHAVERERK